MFDVNVKLLNSFTFIFLFSNSHDLSRFLPYNFLFLIQVPSTRISPLVVLSKDSNRCPVLSVRPTTLITKVQMIFQVRPNEDLEKGDNEPNRKWEHCLIRKNSCTMSHYTNKVSSFYIFLFLVFVTTAYSIS